MTPGARALTANWTITASEETIRLKVIAVRGVATKDGGEVKVTEASGSCSAERPCSWTFETGGSR